jgi:aryl-alcohol dehydrogenase-like predicted oxidoreductase
VELRRLGTSGLEVSRLSFGAMTFGSQMPPISNTDRAAAEALLERAVDAGINLVDTADAYSRGESEEILAPLLARHRDHLLLATKLGWGREHERPLSRENVTASVEDSLRRLGTDRIDVLYLHRPDRSTPIEETFDALDDLVGRGLVGTVGVSNWTAGETGYTVGRQRGLGRSEPTSVQVYWSLVGREVEQEIVPTCTRLDVGVVVWSPLAGGFLADRHNGRRTLHAFPPVDETLGAKVLEALRGIAAESGTTPAAVAIAWLLARPEVTSVIIGASRMEQLDANLAAADLKLETNHLATLEAASAIDPIYPRWWDTAMGVPS